MAGMASDEPSRHGSHEGNNRICQDKPDEDGGRWYYSRKEIDEDSPSRRDGIDLKKETYLRKSYCTFLQDLGMRLKVPQVTIATAIIFCHRFFLRQSHAKNDRRTIATVCMFLAGKVEETPRPLKDVILVSYEIIHKKDAAAAQRIKQKEVYEQQKELILLGERVVLTTLGFDLNVHHPYKPLVEAIKKFEVAQSALAQVAWNFVNDGLRTSLCLQFKPQHIAAGAIFLAAKFLRVRLPTEPEKSWWMEFDVTPRQLEEVSNQMLELYEQTKVPPSQASEAEGSAGGSQKLPSKAPANMEHGTSNSSSHVGGSLKGTSSKPAPSRPLHDQSLLDNHNGPPRPTQNNECESSETNSVADHRGDSEVDETLRGREALPHQANSEEMQNKSSLSTEGHYKDDQEGNSGRMDTGDTVEPKDKSHGKHLSHKDGRVSQSPQNAPIKLDKDKIKATLERRKAFGELSRKTGPVDELEREIEDVEVPVSEKLKREKKSNPLNRPETENSHIVRYENEAGEVHDGVIQGQSSHGDDSDLVEEGEVQQLDDGETGHLSPKSNSRKRKSGSPLEKPEERKQLNDYKSSSQKENLHDYAEDSNG